MKTRSVFSAALSLLLCLCMLLSMAVPGFGAEASARKAADALYESTKTLTNAGDEDADTYTIDIDAIVNGQASTSVTGTPLDVAIVFDRSDSMSQPANKNDVKKFPDTTQGKADMLAYLDTLPKDKWDGYYRANNIASQGARFYNYVEEGQTRIADEYISWEVLRYDSTQGWVVYQTIYNSSTTNGNEWDEGPHGILTNTTRGYAGYYGEWVPVSQAFDDFYDRKAIGYYTNSDANVQFSIAVPRLTKAQEAIESFIIGLNNKADNLPEGTNHTVSVTSFGGTVFKNEFVGVSSTTGNALKAFHETHADQMYDMKSSAPSIQLAGSDATAAQKNAMNSFIGDIIKNQYIYGNTRTDHAMEEMADRNFLPAKQEGRSRVVILLTDGAPTGRSLFQENVANDAITAAKALKDEGVQIISLSYMDGVNSADGYDPNINPSDEFDRNNEPARARNFLHLVSSNYPDATNMKTPGTQAANDNFLSDDGKGNQLLQHFNTILEKITTDFETPLPQPDDSVTIYDEITREFMIDADRKAKVYVQEYKGNGQFGNKVYIGEHTLTANSDATFTQTNAYKIFWDCSIPQADGTAISGIRLNWLDARNAALRELDVTNEGSPYKQYTKGYKIGIELPVQVDRNNTLGGNNIETNTPASGLFLSKTTDGATTALGTGLVDYPEPNATVGIVNPFENRVFDYFMTLENLVANPALSPSDSFAKSIFAAMIEDPQTLLNYLQYDLDDGYDGDYNDYVDMVIELKNADGEVLYKLIVDVGSGTYRVEGPENGADFDFSQDQTLTADVKLTYNYSNQNDSVGVPPKTELTYTLYPNYYAPKYVVVDFDENVKVSLDTEGELSPKMKSGNGQIQGSGISFDFRATYGSGDKKFLEEVKTLTYTVTAKNGTKPAKAGEAAIKSVDRNFYVIPANVMTYDDTLLTYLGESDYQAGSTELTKGIGTWETEGTFKDSEQSHDNTVTHGYDSLYTGSYSQTYYHNAISGVTVSANTFDAEGKSNADGKGIAQAEFTFKGTGFDILSQTSENSGAMTVEVIDTKGTVQKLILVDTYLKGQTLNQIPVVHVEDLTYGTWKIRITAFYDTIFDHHYQGYWGSAKKSAMTEEALRTYLNVPAEVDFTFIPSESGYGSLATRLPAAGDGTVNDRHYNVYIDGVRIYNPLGSSLSTIAAYGYSEAKEGYANIVNINDKLVDANAASWGSGKTFDGVLYAATGLDQVTNGQTSAGIILGMEGELPNDGDADKDGYYKVTGVTLNGSSVYYKKETVTIPPSVSCPDGSTFEGLNFYYDNGSEKVKMNTKEIRYAFGYEPLYYNSTYSQYGPEKEVYLQAGHGIAFTVGKNVTKAMISLKSQNGQTAVLSCYNSAGTKLKEFTTSNRVEMYYDITDCMDANGNVFLKCTTGTVSVCNIKTIGGTAAAAVTVNDALAVQAARVFKNATLPVDEGAEIKHTLDLASDITLNYAVATSKLADYDESYMEVTFRGETYFLEPQIRGSYGYFAFTGITAVEMTEELTAKLHLFLGEDEYVSETDVYCVADYAYGQLNKDNASAALKTVCADLLRYGALAQSYKGMDTLPADADMTDVQKAYLTDLTAVSVNSIAKALGDVENAIAWAGKSLVLDSKVAVKAIFDLKDYAGDVEALSLRVTYVNMKGEEVAQVLDSAEVYNQAKGYYAFTLDTLYAGELRTELTMALYQGDTQVSETQIYSVESYCAGRTGALAELGKALLAYGDSAKAFFTN